MEMEDPPKLTAADSSNISHLEIHKFEVIPLSFACCSPVPKLQKVDYP